MGYKSIETNYLISLISSVLNKRIPPLPLRAIDWRSLYYLAEYHNITNTCYYSLIGVSDNVPDIWKERFAKIFRKWVRTSGEQVKEVSKVLEALEHWQIGHMVLEDWMMKGFYPQADMRAVDDVVILIKPDHEKVIKVLMRELGYHYERAEENGNLAFYKTIRSRIIFCHQLLYKNRKLRPYFSKIWKRAQLIPGSSYRYTLNIDELYIYLIASMCDSYAFGEIDVRDIIDLHLYLDKYKDEMTWQYIETTLNSLELSRMAKCLGAVGDMWFGVYEGDEARECKDIEEYIWSRGTYGRETSITLLPMMLDMEIWKIQDERRERIRRFLRWWFPDVEYMQGLYPRAERLKILLPFFWLLRFLHLGFSSLMIVIRRISRFLSFRINCWLEKKHIQRMEKSEDKERKDVKEHKEL